ncbi:hypothetical protein [Lentzea sp. NPDC059081]|uniref:hypothetical protein n=1 Tax=Lentzea sp. NPDC059081 TaxID=3346719 RepID=UPI00369DDCCA
MRSNIRQILARVGVALVLVLGNAPLVATVWRTDDRTAVVAPSIIEHRVTTEFYGRKASLQNPAGDGSLHHFRYALLIHRQWLVPEYGAKTNVVIELERTVPQQPRVPSAAQPLSGSR